MMTNLLIREPCLADEALFLAAMQRSVSLHHPWVKAPGTSEDFNAYVLRYQQPDQKSYLVFTGDQRLIGVFNLSEIIRGCFQNAFLGFYAAAECAGQGLMSAGLKLVLKQAFTDLALHRLEANIQPDNQKSLNLVRRNGFRKEGYSPRYLHINGEWRDHERWALTLEDVQSLTMEKK